MTFPSIPEKMFGISIQNPSQGSGSFSDGELVYGEQSTPIPQPHEMLIRVAYAGVNRADIFQRQGHYPPPQGASALPGLEVSGHIAALGENVREWKIGDAVCALLSGGGYAEYAIAHAGHIFSVPKNFSLPEAAALPEALVTIWMALHEEAKLKSGEKFLVHGGASSIGMMAIQYAKYIGAEVFTTASNPRKLALCKEWGASHLINYTEEDFVAHIKNATKNSGVNVILDFIGGDYIARNFSALSVDGRMISLAFLRGAKIAELNVASLLMKRILWKGITLRAQSDDAKTKYVRDICDALSPALEAGYIKPHVDRIFKITDAKKAQSYMEDNLNGGKIILGVESVYC